MISFEILVVGFRKFGGFRLIVMLRSSIRTAKIGCGSKIYFYSQNNRLHVRRYDFRHNHEVRPDLVQFPPKRRRTKQEKAEEEAATEAAVKASSGMLPLVEKCQLPLSLPRSDLNFVEEGINGAEGNENCGDDLDDEEEDFFEDGIDEADLRQLCLPSNGCNGHQNLLEGWIVSLSSM